MRSEARKSINFISKWGCPNLHAVKINKQYSYMTITASEVYADFVLLYKLNIFQSWTFLIKIYNILKNNILICSCWASVERWLLWRYASRSNLLYSGFRYTIELPLQPYKIQLYTFRVQGLAFFLPWFPDYYSFYLSMGNALIGTHSLLKSKKQNCKLQKWHEHLWKNDVTRKLSGQAAAVLFAGTDRLSPHFKKQTPAVRLLTWHIRAQCYCVVSKLRLNPTSFLIVQCSRVSVKLPGRAHTTPCHVRVILILAWKNRHDCTT